MVKRTTVRICPAPVTTPEMAEPLTRGERHPLVDVTNTAGVRPVEELASTSPATTCPSSNVSSLFMLRQCSYKLCKKLSHTQQEDSVVHCCANPRCTTFIHRTCSNHLVASFPEHDRVDVDDVVCGKRCNNAVRKLQREATAASDTVGKKRVMWHSDGCSPSVSSLSCLLDWMTSGDNYSRYRGGDGQVGETKMALAAEVVRAISAAGISTQRTAKDVMTKISSIEASYKAAADWLANTGQGVASEESLKSAILQRCPYYYELYPVMQDRPSTQPLLLNTDPSVLVDSSECDSDGDKPAPASATTCVPINKRPASTPLSIGPSKKTKNLVPDIPPTLVQLKAAQLKHDQEISHKHLEYRKREIELQSNEMQMRMKRSEIEEREMVMRVEETAARTTKLQLESEHWRLQSKILLLRERKKLADEGVPTEEINALLPLST